MKRRPWDRQKRSRPFIRGRMAGSISDSTGSHSRARGWIRDIRAAARESSSSARGAVQLSEKSSRPFSATPTVAKGLRVSAKG